MTPGVGDVFATLPLATYQPGEIILAEGSKTGRLWILKKGAVAVVRQGIQIARVAEPGAAFGDLSALLDTPHTADGRALAIWMFQVADAARSLQAPALLGHAATVLAQRLNGAKQALIELKTKPS